MRHQGPMPDLAFRMMALCFRIMDRFSSPLSKLDNMGIKPGDTVIDYGCGPGRYIKKASQLVGREGMVYGVDLHHLAVSAVNELALKENLNNVIALQANEFSVALPDHGANIVYAFDMFHMVENTGAFLQELYRLLKPEGTMFIEPGHQAFSLAREKILSSGQWRIIKEENRCFKCMPQ